VDYDSIAGTVTRLRTELQQIGTENRMHFEKRNRSEEELRRHQRRQDRIVEIKLELENILKKKKTA
jgi:hypothetical protein